MLGTQTFDGLATWCRAIKHGHGAGLPLVRMFEMQAKNGPATFRQAAGRIARKLEHGDSLEETLAAEAPQLPELFISMAAVGERSGRIPEVFGQLEEYYRLQGQMRREFRSQAIRPAIMFVGAVLVIAFTIFVLGQLASGESGPTAPIGFGSPHQRSHPFWWSWIGRLDLRHVVTNTVAKQASFEACSALAGAGPGIQAGAQPVLPGVALTLDS